MRGSFATSLAFLYQASLVDLASLDSTVDGRHHRIVRKARLAGYPLDEYERWPWQVAETIDVDPDDLRRAVLHVRLVEAARSARGGAGGSAELRARLYAIERAQIAAGGSGFGLGELEQEVLLDRVDESFTLASARRFAAPSVDAADVSARRTAQDDATLITAAHAYERDVVDAS